MGLYGLPRMLTFIVTFACNARCVMCDSWKKNPSGELNIGEIERIFHQLPALDVVRISGGEPFLRQDIGGIVRLAGEILKPVVIHITTNGMLTDRIVGMCRDRDRRIPLILMVSVDGMEDTHNRIRGRSGAWKRAIQTIRDLAPSRKALNIRLYVNQTIVDENGIREYGELRNCLRQFGIQNNVVFAYDGSATYSQGDFRLSASGVYESIGRLGRDTICSFLKETGGDIRMMKLPVRIAKNYYLSGFKNRLLESKNYPNPRCAALNTHMRLNPDGSVPVCQFNSTVVGRLGSEPFSAVWSGRTIGEMRSWVRSCPGCWAECEALPSGLYSGAVFGGIFKEMFD